MSLTWTDAPGTTVNIDGATLEYACFGPAPDCAPTIVLLHEALGSVALWRDFPRALAEATGCGVMAYSRAGYGRSSPVDLPRPFDYHMPEAEKVLPAVLDALNPASAVLVGHSDGATIAALHAANTPDPRVAGIVLMAPHFFVEDVTLAGLRQARTAYENGPIGPSLAKYHDHPDMVFYGWNDIWLNPAFRSWRVDDVLSKIGVPILALQGREDQYATLEQINTVARIQPVLTTHTVIEGCGHSPQFEKPDETLDATARFIKKLPLQAKYDAFA